MVKKAVGTEKMGKETGPKPAAKTR